MLTLLSEEVCDLSETSSRLVETRYSFVLRQYL